MPGKHAPPTSASFYLSVARAAAGALAVLAVIAVIAVVAVNSRGNDADPSLAGGSASPSPSATVEPSKTQRPSPSPDAPPPPSLRAPADVGVRVLNANRVSGLAGRTADELEQAGYQVLEPGNHPTVPKTIVYYRGDFGPDAEKLRAEHFDWVEASQVKKANKSLPNGNIVVVLGRDHPDA